MRWLPIALVVTACGKSSEPPCAQRAAELGAWAISIAPEGDTMVTATGVTLVDAPDAPLLQPGRVTSLIRITRDETPDDPTELRDRVLRDRARARDGDRLRAQLWIDRDAPMDRIAAVADVLARAGVHEAEIVFRRAAKSSTPPPPRSAVSDQLDAVMRAEPSTRATEVARIMQTVVASCPSFKKAFGRVASEEPESKAMLIARSLERATVDCDCNLDLPSMRSIMWDLLGPGDKPLMGAVAVTLAPADDPHARAITGAIWADAAPAVIAAHGAPIRFAPR